MLSQGHFRSRPLTLEWLEELSSERAEAVYADRFADLGDATFVFVGAFDWDNLRSLAATYLASLPTTGRVEQWRDVGIDPPTEQVDQVVRSGIEPRSRTVLAFAGDMEWSRQEALTLTVAGEMLQTRLRERIREELGGTYSIGVIANSMSLPDPEYLVYIVFGSDPSRAEELLDEVLAEVEWLRDGGEQSYLDTAKELLSTPRQEQLRDNGFWLNQIQTVTQRGESFDGDQPLRRTVGRDHPGASRGRGPALLHRRPLRAGGAAPGRGLAQRRRGWPRTRSPRPGRRELPRRTAFGVGKDRHVEAEPFEPVDASMTFPSWRWRSSHYEADPTTRTLLPCRRLRSSIVPSRSLLHRLLNRVIVAEFAATIIRPPGLS